MATLKQAALSRVLPRYRAAFGCARYYWQAGTCVVPLSIEQGTAIESGATNIPYGSSLQLDARIEGDFLCLNGDRHLLHKGMLKPEELVVSVDRDSSHMNVSNILSELEIATGVEAARWHITVDADGTAEVEVAPSVAFVADEIRKRPVTDVYSVAEWLQKYDVSASAAQLAQVFGISVSSKLPAAEGRNETAIKDFFAPLDVFLHSGGRCRKVTATGTTSVRTLVKMDASRIWHLHGVPLLPFGDIPMWRCCTHSNKELHLYDEAHKGEWETRDTLAGVLRVPTGVRGYVPYPTVSGSMLGNPCVFRVQDVVATAPGTLDRFWLARVNGNDYNICIDRAIVMVDALQQRYGRAACIAAIGKMLPPRQQGVFLKMMARVEQPQSKVRRRYACYLQCIKDLLNGTSRARPLQLLYSGHAFPISPLTSWKNITSAIPSGWSCVLAAPTGLTARMALQRGDFIMEELRTDNIEIKLEHVQVFPVNSGFLCKRKRTN